MKNTTLLLSNILYIVNIKINTSDLHSLNFLEIS